jgi:hypothetical protein
MGTDPFAGPATWSPHDVVEPTLRSALTQMAASLRERHPTASDALVRRCVDDALRRFHDAPVRVYLPILIERWSQAALRDALGALERGLAEDHRDGLEPKRRARLHEGTR